MRARRTCRALPGSTRLPTGLRWLFGNKTERRLRWPYGGSELLLAALPTYADGLAVALLGVGIGSVVHTASHVIGRDLGGNPLTDIPALAALSIVLLVAGWVHQRQVGLAARQGNE